MNDLGITGGNSSNDFATIPDVSVEAIADRVDPNQVTSGVTRGIQQLGSDKVYSDGGNSQIIVKDTVPRVLTGNQPTFGEGFYVSKAGIDATTNTDPTQWIFNSNQDTLKIVLSGTTTINANATAGVPITATIPHNQNFIPIPFVFFNFDGLRFTQLPNSTGLSTAAGQVTLNNWSYATTDATNLYIIFYSGSTSNWGTFTYSYYLLQETAG